MNANTIDNTTRASKCSIVYRDESGQKLTSNHSSKEAAVRFIGRVLAVRHYGPFVIVDR
jgi:hypothetical protein